LIGSRPQLGADGQLEHCSYTREPDLAASQLELVGLNCDFEGVKDVGVRVAAVFIESRWFDDDRQSIEGNVELWERMCQEGIPVASVDT
jgi:hypothetical protein